MRSAREVDTREWNINGYIYNNRIVENRGEGRGQWKEELRQSRTWITVNRSYVAMQDAIMGILSSTKMTFLLHFSIILLLKKNVPL